MMKNLLLLVLLSTSLSACERAAQTSQEVYPWQITLLPGGNSRVFGIEIGRTTLAGATQMLGTRYEEALFQNPDGGLSLEVYFHEVTLGGISGKFILTLAIADDHLQRMRDTAVKTRRMESGATRYYLSVLQRDALGALTVNSISYIPYVNLDEELVTSRFGRPARVVQVAPGKQHWLYPELGLDLLLDADGKELLQYVAPHSFTRLEQPLLRPADH